MSDKTSFLVRENQLAFSKINWPFSCDPDPCFTAGVFLFTESLIFVCAKSNPSLHSKSFTSRNVSGESMSLVTEKVVQFDLFRNEEVMRQNIQEEEFKKNVTKSIRGLFARYNELEEMMLKTLNNIDKLNEIVFKP